MEPYGKEAWASLHTDDLNAIYKLLSILESTTTVKQVKSPRSYDDDVLLFMIGSIVLLNLLREDVNLALFSVFFEYFGDLLVKSCIFLFSQAEVVMILLI